MSAIIHLMGRVTRDPVMQQGKNNGTEYISLDLATSQRSQNAQNNPENPYESVFLSVLSEQASLSNPFISLLVTDSECYLVPTCDC